MRRFLALTIVVAIPCGLVSLGLAGEPNAGIPPQPEKQAAPANSSTTAELRADLHRTLGQLIEAQAAQNPDHARIGELTEKLAQLRGKLRAQNPAAAGSWGAGRGCPWVGPGRGLGMGRGAGLGPGGGRGWGGGIYGRGPGAGRAVIVDEDHDGLCDYYELRQGLHEK